MDQMSQRQWKRLNALQRLGQGELGMREAAGVLGLSVRQVRRMRRMFEGEGSSAVVHGNEGRAPVNRTPDEVRQRVLGLMRETYVGFNDQHFTEKLIEEEGVALSRQTVRRILRASGIEAVRKRRPRKYRSRRERKAQAGLMMLWDGSLHNWLEGRGPYLCLMGAIDDATGELLPGAHFVEHESTAGYLRVLLDVCLEKGLPWSIYMDRHSSLKRNDDHWTLEEELRGEQGLTHVGAALKALEIEPIYALSPQAKGRVERLWGTLQDRLVSELRLAKARTMEEANAVLARYLRTHNWRFAKPAADCQPAWRAVPPRIDLVRVCSLRSEPTVRNDNTVSIGNGAVLQIPKPADGHSYAGKRVELRHLLSGELRVYLRDELLVTVKADPPKYTRRQTRPASPSRTETPPKKRLTFKQTLQKLRGANRPAARTGRTESLAC
jgi:transposase